MHTTYTPLAMPKSEPKRTWTPPSDAKPSAPMPVTLPSDDNAKARRAKRNAGSRYVRDDS